MFNDFQFLTVLWKFDILLPVVLTVSGVFLVAFWVLMRWLVDNLSFLLYFVNNQPKLRRSRRKLQIISDDEWWLLQGRDLQLPGIVTSRLTLSLVRT
jgi:hypothetical protein